MHIGNSSGIKLLHGKVFQVFTFFLGSLTKKDDVFCYHSYETFFSFFLACNILMLEDKRLFTLTNAGEARNCSLTSVFTPNLKLIQFQIGPPSMTPGLLSPVSASHKFPTSTNFSENIHWCVKTHINFSFTIHCICCHLFGIPSSLTFPSVLEPITQTLAVLQLLIRPIWRLRKIYAAVSQSLPKR